MNSFQLKKVLLLTALVVSALPLSPAWAGPAHHSKWERKVALTCARAKNIVLPNNNTQLGADQLNTLHMCEKHYRKNVQTCMKKASVDMNSMTKDQVPTLRQCQAQAVAQIK